MHVIGFTELKVYMLHAPIIYKFGRVTLKQGVKFVIQLLHQTNTIITMSTIERLVQCC